MDATIKLTSIKKQGVEGTPRRAGVQPAALLLSIASIALAGWAALLAQDAGAGAAEYVRVVLVVAWAVVGAAIAVHRPDEPLGLVVALGALVGAAGSVTASMLLEHPSRDAALFVRPIALMALPAVGLHLMAVLPDGTYRRSSHKAIVGIGYLVALGIGVALWTQRPDLPLWPAILVAALVIAIGMGISGSRYRRAKPLERKRMQWFGWAITVAAGIAIVTAATHLLVKWPSSSALPAVVGAATVLVPISLALAASRRLSMNVDRLLASTIALAGLTGLVIIVYFVIVLGLGRVPNSRERSLLLLSMLAAGVAALLYLPTRERLTRFATKLVYGERHAPDEALRTFSQRMTRAVPLDELLLQLAESLRKTLALDTAEVWTGSATALERAVSSPERPKQQISLGQSEESVIARSGVSGPAWMKIWMPMLLHGREDSHLRVAPVTHSGELMGLLVAERRAGGEPFSSDDDLMLAELARQVGLALHNVKLDSALQASLDEVRRQAEELRASRARIVATADAERRRIERNLHDGAQQHLVALAVKVRLVRQLADADPAQSKTMLEELGGEVQETLQELRTLAHGIYPPLLMDRGLAEALTAAATRSVLPTDVRADGVVRYPQEIEAAVYFCCLEALQNAGKHAGEGATANVRVWQEDSVLAFEVADTGVGFDPRDPHIGAGFTNMKDRVGAIGGSLSIDATPGAGVRISGRIPLPQSIPA
jgi:signal transduction histidine kinase